MFRMKTRSGSGSERERRHSPKPEESTPRGRSSVSKGKSPTPKGKSSTPKGKSSATKGKLPTPEAKPSTSKAEYTVCEVKPSTSKDKSPTPIRKFLERKARPTTPSIRSSHRVGSLPKTESSTSGSRSSSPKAEPSTSKTRSTPSVAFSTIKTRSTSSVAPSTSKTRSTPSVALSTAKTRSTSSVATSTSTFSPRAGPSTSTFSPRAGPSTSSPRAIPSTSSPKERPPSPWAGPSLYKRKTYAHKRKLSASTTKPPSCWVGLSAHESRPRKRKSSPKAGPSSTSVRASSTSIMGRSKSRGINMDLTKGAIFMNHMQNREIGSVRPTRFIETTRQMKVEDYKKMRSHKFGSGQRVSSHTVYFVRAGRNALVAAWYAESAKGFTSVVSQLYYDINKIEPGSTKFVTSTDTVIDACQAYVNPDIFVFITCDRSPKGNLNIAAPAFDGSEDTVSYSYFHPNEKPFNCVNSNFHTKKFAVGLDGEVCIFTVTGIQEMRMFSDNIYGLAYNKRGTVLHLGCENGDFLLYDLRTVNTYQRLKLDNNILDDVTILSDENYCIVTGHNNKLMKVDVRVNKKVFDFQTPYRRSRKIPVSFNAQLDLASCTGADNITRIWDMNAGNLMHSFEAESTYPARSCLVPHAFRGQLHLIQDNYIHVYSMLR